MDTSKFLGTGVALVTPFRKDMSVDYQGLEALVEHVVANGADYLVVLGTTGESATLSKDEQKAVSSFVIKANNGRLPVMIGIGGNNTQHVVQAIKEQDFNGIDSILSVSPYYNKPSQRGIIGHYSAIAAVSPVPVLLYNVPGRTRSNMKASTTLELANEFPDVFLGIKEASGDMEQISKILKDKPDNFLVISGDDGLTVPIISLGGHGAISVTANAYPKAYSEMVRKAMAGDFEGARKNHFKLLDFMGAMFEEGSPAGIKAALKLLNVCPSHVRLPLANVTRGHNGVIDKIMGKMKFE